MGGSPVSRNRRGFALVAMLVAIVIMLVVAVTATSSVASFADHRRIDIATNLLAQLTDSTRVGIVRFRADVGNYPGALTQLRSQISTNDLDICGTKFSNPETDEWGAPYVSRHVSASGMWIGVGMVRNTFTKDPASGNPSVNNPHALVVHIDDVDARDAMLLNTRFDAEGETAPAAEGRVRWGTPAADGRVTVEWRTTITAC